MQIVLSTVPVTSGTTSLRGQVAAGVALTALGVADLGGALPALSNYAYAILWWGVLLLVDAWNSRRHSVSMWRGDAVRFVAVMLPASVLVWLFFEALNVPAPQWRYRVGIPWVPVKVLYGFASFSTVIPIMAESWWLVGGSYCLPESGARWFREHKPVCLILAAVFAAVPFFNKVFWFNQGMWLIPAFALLPYVRPDSCPGRRFTRTLVLSALLAGVAWESLNYTSQTHWEYLVLPGAPHLFFMPLPGYLGFIPFAFSMLAVYEFARRVQPTVLVGASLYIAAFAGLYWWTALYVDHL